MHLSCNKLEHIKTTKLQSAIPHSLLCASLRIPAPCTARAPPPAPYTWRPLSMCWHCEFPVSPTLWLPIILSNAFMLLYLLSDSLRVMVGEKGILTLENIVIVGESHKVYTDMIFEDWFLPASA